jgi:hypothetical protein
LTDFSHTRNTSYWHCNASIRLFTFPEIRHKKLHCDSNGFHVYLLRTQARLNAFRLVSPDSYFPLATRPPPYSSCLDFLSRFCVRPAIPSLLLSVSCVSVSSACFGIFRVVFHKLSVSIVSISLLLSFCERSRLYLPSPSALPPSFRASKCRDACHALTIGVPTVAHPQFSFRRAFVLALSLNN